MRILGRVTSLAVVASLFLACGGKIEGGGTPGGGYTGESGGTWTGVSTVDESSDASGTVTGSDGSDTWEGSDDSSSDWTTDETSDNTEPNDDSSSWSDESSSWDEGSSSWDDASSEWNGSSDYSDSDWSSSEGSSDWSGDYSSDASDGWSDSDASSAAACVDFPITPANQFCVNSSDCTLVVAGEVCPGECACGASPGNWTASEQQQSVLSSFPFSDCACPPPPATLTCSHHRCTF